MKSPLNLFWPNLLLKWVPGLVWFLLTALPALAQVSLSGYTPPVSVKPTQLPLTEKVRQGAAPLSRLQPDLKLEATPLRRLPALAPQASQQERKSGRLRIGVLRAFEPLIEGIKASAAWRVAQGQLYLLRVRANGATAVRLHFTDVKLPLGARLFVYARHNPEDLAGPYAGEGRDGVPLPREFWTPPLAGEEIVVEYFQPANQINNQATPFRIDQLSHIFLKQQNTDNRGNSIEQTGPGICNQEVPAEWSEASKSVGLLTYTDMKGEFACSGVLVNNVKNDGTPYFLTAHHCLNQGRYFLSPPTVFWNYDGGATLPPPESRSLGAQLLATGPASDFSLLRLSYVPQGVRFAGWSTQQPTVTTSVTSIHHPQASYKRFSNGQTVNDCLEGLPGADCNNYWRVRWQGGITEPGSSGAPLFTGPPSDPRVVGLLTGGLSACSNRNGIDAYGRFDLSFNALAYYLTGQGCLTTLWPTEEFFGFPPPFKTSHVFSAAGGAGSVKLKVLDGDACVWTATSNAAWITLTAPTSGSLARAGEATITYTVAPYNGTRPRNGLVLIGGQSLLVVQGSVSNCNAAPLNVGQFVNGALARSDCRSAIEADAFADRYTFNAQAGQQIIVSLSSQEVDTYLLVYAPDGTLLDFNDDFDYTSNSRVPAVTTHPLMLPASGTYTIEATSFFAEELGNYRLQLERACVFLVAPVPPTPVQLFPANGGAGKLNITGPPDCTWNATTNVPWITFNGATSGTANGMLSFTVAPNPDIADNNGVLPREGQITVGTTRYLIKQSPVCAFRVIPTNISIKPGDVYYGNPYPQGISVSTGFGCPFTVKSNVPWIEFPDRGGQYSAEGPQTVGFKFNSIKLGNEPRTGTITVAGQLVTITQEPIGAACPATPLTVGQTLSDALSPNCRSLLGYTGAVKQYRFRGRVGQRIALALSSAEVSLRAWVLPLNSDESLNVNWRLDAQEFGLTNFHAPANGFSALPSDGDYLIEIASSNQLHQNASGYVLTLTEAPAANCVFATTPLHSNFAAGAATGTLTVSATSGSACTWTALSTVPWITITAGASGTGTGAVNYTVATNPGAFRVGTIVAAGWHLVITQQPGNAPAVVSAADYGADLTVGQIVALFGTGLATQNASAQTLPLPTQLAGTKVTFRDSTGRSEDAPLFFVSAGQINFLIPYSLQLGPVTITVQRNNNNVAVTTAQLGYRAPRLFTADASGRGVPAGYVLRVRNDGTRREEPIVQRDGTGRLVPRPISLPDNETVYLIVYGTGFGAQSSAQPLQAQLGNVQQEGFLFNAPGFAGLEQINLLLPRELRGKGDVQLVLTMLNTAPATPPTKPVTLRFTETLSTLSERKMEQ